METTEPTQSRRPDTFARRCAVAIGVALVLMLCYGAMILSIRSHVASELARIRAEGDPVTYEEPSLPATWPADDAADDYQAAVGELDALRLSSDDIDLLSVPAEEWIRHLSSLRRPLLNPAQFKRRTQILQLLGPYYAAIRRACAKPEYRRWMLNERLTNDIDGENNHHVIIMKARARDAMSAPDPQAYFESVDALLCRACYRGRGPTIGPIFERQMFLDPSIHLLELGLGRLHFTDSQLEAISDRLNDFGREVDLPRVVKNERAKTLDLIAATHPVLWDLPHLEFTNLKVIQSVLADTAYQYAGGIDADRLACLNRMREEIRICGLSPVECHQAMNAYLEEDKHVPWYCRIARERGEALWDLIETIEDADSKVDLARTAVALERYRLAHGGRLPANLGELVPRYLHAIPADPVSGNPEEFIQGPCPSALILDKGYVLEFNAMSARMMIEFSDQ